MSILAPSPFLFSLDWLQLGGKLGKVQFFEAESPYTVKARDISTPLFKQVIDLYDQGLNQIAVILFEPRSSIIPANTVLVKVINRVLYSSKIHEHVKNISTCFNIEFKHITRADLCIDFNTFIEYEYPELFIKEFVSDQITKLGKGKFMTIGTVTKPHLFDYIKFGSPKSNICYYLYNKSKELQQVKDKPYIREFWELNGIDPQRPVWRLEFSVKTPKFLISEVDTDTGELLENEILDFNKILSRKYQLIMLNNYLDKYWQFVRTRKVKRMDRLERIRFIDLPRDYTSIRKQDPAKDATKTDKIFIKKLHQVRHDETLINKLELLNSDLRGNDNEVGSTLDDLIHTFVVERKLMDWYQKKVNDNESLH